MFRFVALHLVMMLAASPLAADTRMAPVVTPLEIDELGLPIIRVTLHTRANPEITRTFRFVLDTGASGTVVDSRIPPAFLWEDPESRGKMTDSAGTSREVAMAFVKRLEVGGSIQDDFHVSVQDLQALMGRFQDCPADGILGLDFLNRTRFTLDLKARTVTWWATPLPGMVELKGGRGSDGRVYVLIDAGRGESPAVVDTGLGGGISLPEQQAPVGDGPTTASPGLFGGSTPGREMRLPRLTSGKAAWLDVPVVFESNVPAGSIGEDVWACGSVWFDLIGSPRVRVSLDGKGNLPIDRLPPRRLPVVWQGTGAARRMIVLKVKAGSAMEKSGCKAGDQVIQAGDLKGETLTRRAIQDLVASGKAHTWIVRRDGKDLQIFFPHDTPGGQEPNS